MIAARRPRITTTTMTSISVNPRARGGDCSITDGRSIDRMTLDSMRCRMTERGVGRTPRDGEAAPRLGTLLPSERATIPQAVAPLQRISLQKSTLRRRQPTVACGRRDLDTRGTSRHARVIVTRPALYWRALRIRPADWGLEPQLGRVQPTNWSGRACNARGRAHRLHRAERAFQRRHRLRPGRVSAEAQARSTAGQATAARTLPLTSSADAATQE